LQLQFSVGRAERMTDPQRDEGLKRVRQIRAGVASGTAGQHRLEEADSAQRTEESHPEEQEGHTPWAQHRQDPGGREAPRPAGLLSIENQEHWERQAIVWEQRAERRRGESLAGLLLQAAETASRSKAIQWENRLWEALILQWRESRDKVHEAAGQRQCKDTEAELSMDLDDPEVGAHTEGDHGMDLESSSEDSQLQEAKAGLLAWEQEVRLVRQRVLAAWEDEESAHRAQGFTQEEQCRLTLSGSQSQERAHAQLRAEQRVQAELEAELRSQADLESAHRTQWSVLEEKDRLSIAGARDESRAHAKQLSEHRA
jgi:hypothetical protein